MANRLVAWHLWPQASRIYFLFARVGCGLTSRPSGRAKNRAPLNSSVRGQMAGSTADEVIEQRLAETLLVEPIFNELVARSVELSLTYCEPTSNIALRLDVDDSSAIGRLTWWSDGSVYLEALCSSDESSLLSAHLVALSSEQALGMLKVLVAIVGSLPSNKSFKADGFAAA